MLEESRTSLMAAIEANTCPDATTTMFVLLCGYRRQNLGSFRYVYAGTTMLEYGYLSVKSSVHFSPLVEVFSSGRVVIEFGIVGREGQVCHSVATTPARNSDAVAATMLLPCRVTGVHALTRPSPLAHPTWSLPLRLSWIRIDLFFQNAPGL